jgi:hypothetical protein
MSRFGKNHRELARARTCPANLPISCRSPPGTSTISLEPLAIRQMNNQWIEGAAVSFASKIFATAIGLRRLGGESVNSFCRQRDNVAFSQQFNRRIAVG